MFAYFWDILSIYQDISNNPVISRCYFIYCYSSIIFFCLFNNLMLLSHEFMPIYTEEWKLLKKEGGGSTIFSPADPVLRSNSWNSLGGFAICRLLYCHWVRSDHMIPEFPSGQNDVILGVYIYIYKVVLLKAWIKSEKRKREVEREGERENERERERKRERETCPSATTKSPVITPYGIVLIDCRRCGGGFPKIFIFIFKVMSGMAYSENPTG